MAKNCLCIFIVLLVAGCANKKETVKISYFENGEIKSISRHKNGNLDGQCVWLYPNGNVEQIVPFVNGVASGRAIYFYESGALKSTRQWHAGKLNGLVTDYANDTIGKVNTVVLFENGVIKDLRRNN